MKRRSFTLLEISIATIVLAVAIMSLLAAISINFKMQASNKETMIAMGAAQEEINKYLTDPFIFRTVNKEPNSNPALTPVNPALTPIPFLVDGLQLQTGDVAHGIVDVQGVDIDGVTPIAPSYGNAPTGISYIKITVNVRWSGVSGNRNITLYSERYRMFEDSQMQNQ